MCRSGIYRIRLSADGRCYVGSAKNIAARWRSHVAALGRGKHHSRYLQAAWVKYGHASFVFEVLEYVENAEDLIHREQHWIDTLRVADSEYGFNMRPKADSNLGITFGPLSDPHRAALSAASLGKPKSASHRLNISIGQRTKREPKTIETRLKHAAALKGRTVAQEIRDRISATTTGVPKPLAHREAMKAGWERNWGRKPAEPPKGGRARPQDERNSISAKMKGVPKTASHREAMRLAWERRRAAKPCPQPFLEPRISPTQLGFGCSANG